jgi:two-component system cell cycle sensor histidine kinase/response regulator CckA
MTRADLLPFRAIFFDAADAMLILDDDRRVVEANPAACSLFGLTADDMRAQSLDTLMSGDEEAVTSAWHELLALGEAKREHRVAHAAGTRTVECSYRARVHAHRHLCIARDITERRLLEERLAHSEKIESVGRLAGGIAHDFNNLLTAILGYTELLLGSRAPGDPDRADLEEIQRAGQRAATLTQQLLAFGRRQTLRPKDVDLNEVVAGLQGMLGRLIREDITLTCALTQTPAIVHVDATQIEQALVNLVLNARDALPAGGEIRIELARVPRRGGHPGGGAARRATDFVRLRVIDTGVGMSPEARAHLFEPFFTTKEVGQGSGLGLASVYGIVRQSEGTIEVDSAPGKGTMFTLHFPAVRPIPETQASGPPAVRSCGHETILLVEDEESVRSVIATVLRRQGYQVLEAVTPGVASDIFDRREPDIDMLLTDVVMPGMNGPELAERLMRARPELAVLYISGYADVSFDLGRQRSHVGFLHKPFHASTLVGRVRELLASSAGALESLPS